MKRLPLIIFGAATLLWSCEAKQPKDASGNAAQSGQTTPESRGSNPELAAQQVNEINTGNENAGARPALNPAHGEPYHRCDIEVGAPLDSPAPAATPMPQTSQVPAGNNFDTNPISPSLSAPAPSVSSTSADGPKPALNPPHGEPHHRCDLQVGAPLT